jgi:TonB family protein
MRRIARIAIVLAGASVTNSALAGEANPHVDTSGVNMQPAYPASALPNREGGEVVMRVRVTESGKVSQIRLLETSGFNDLDSAAIAAVLTWRFIPATKSGDPVPGNANVAVAFEPPDAQTAAGQSDAPKSKEEFLPSLIHFRSSRNDLDTKTRPVPCSNGRLIATVTFVPNGSPYDAHWGSAASLAVTRGTVDTPSWEWASLFIVQDGIHLGTTYNLNYVNVGGKRTFVPFSHGTRLGINGPVWITWDASGLVTATLGGAESHAVRLSGAPSTLTFGISGGTGDFHGAELICYPGVPPPLTN